MRFEFLSAIALLAACNGGLKGPDTPVPTQNTVTNVTVPVTNTQGTGTTPVTVTAPGCDDTTLPTQAQNIFGQRCSACHGPDSQKYGGFGDALDAAAMITDGWVVASSSATSKIYTEISPGPAGEAPAMPIATGGGPLVPTEVAVIKSWIDCGAQDWAGLGTVPPGDDPASRGFITPEMEFTAALSNVALLPVVDTFGADQPDARYLSLVPLYNGGVPSDRIELYTQALTKLMWSLTIDDSPPVLVPVNLDGITLRDGSVVQISGGLGNKLIWRIDERDFQWDEAVDNQVVDPTIDVWEELMKAYPFGIRYDQQFDAAQSLVALTHTRIPIAHGDWFVDNASLPPLYFDVLDMPNNYLAFQQQFGGIDSQLDFDQNRVDCVGMDGQASLVSNFNRVQCRHDSANGYFWESFDFAGEAGGQNIFSNPVDFAAFRAGGESFTSLPDGQQVYFVYNAAENRLDDAPSNVVTDYSPDSDRVVHTGQSCMHCHESGVLERDDQLLDAVLAQQGAFDQATIDQVQEWFPQNSDWPTKYTGDINDFTNSVTAAGVVIGEEPTWALSRDYEAPVTQARVAADLGIPAAILQGAISTNAQLQVQFASLFNGTTNSIDRFTLEGVAINAICDLQLGDVCPNAVDFCGAVDNFGNFIGSSVPCAAGSVCNAEGECTKF
jgi:mono/diheme cytochrome c family protein